MTFGRYASVELRDRVRAQLVTAEALLADPGQWEVSRTDPMLGPLLAGDAAARGLRQERLRTALASFDSATIATTHQFCLRMLTGLGVAGDHDRDAHLSEDIDDLVRQVAADEYLGSAMHTRPVVDLSVAQEIARHVVGSPLTRLAPDDPAPESADAGRQSYAATVLAAVDRRKRRERLLSYDDLQIRLRDALLDPHRGERAREVLRRRFRVVMVDEFQDTDPVQWDILRLAFHGHTTLVLVGDPKQAIYAFRGGDVTTYLSASSEADHTQTLTTNWRSDARLVDGLQHVLGGIALGDPEIVVRPVNARHSGSRLSTADHEHVPAVRIRRVPREVVQPGAPVRGKLRVQEVRSFIAADLAADLARLLAAGSRLQSGAGLRQVSAGDVAVLVNTNDQGSLVREALARRAVPAVVTAASSVFATQAAQQWKTLLVALESPHRSPAVRALALTPFLGWSAEALATASEAELSTLSGQVVAWAQLLERRGMAAVVQAVQHAGLPQRVPSARMGSVSLTDLRHVGESLQEAARAHGLGAASLLSWLRTRIANAAKDAAVERSRRLSTDADAVQIVTVHRAKGLEYPIVYVPFAADRFVPDEPFPLLLHDEQGRRVLDIGTNRSAGWRQRRDQHAAEAAGEELRKLYVALTRAGSQVTTWWMPATTTPRSALHRVLFAERQLDGSLAAQAGLPTDDEARARLAALAEASGGTVAVEEAVPLAGQEDEMQKAAVPGNASASGPAAALPLLQAKEERPEPLRARQFERRLDTDWRRTSYTGLTSAAHEVSARIPSSTEASEPDEYILSDEPAVPAEGFGLDPSLTDWLLSGRSAAAGSAGDAELEQVARAVVSPMAELPEARASARSCMRCWSCSRLRRMPTRMCWASCSATNARPCWPGAVATSPPTRWPRDCFPAC